MFRSRLLAWEEELAKECRALLTDVSLQDIVTNVWLWQPNVADRYTVRNVYQMLTRQEMHN